MKTISNYDELTSVVKSFISKDDFEYSGCTACYLDIQDSNDVASEYKRYMKKTGRIYDIDDHKEPSSEMFINLYFGKYVGDRYGAGLFITPDFYVCKNKKRASQLYKIISDLAYHDRFRQEYTEVDLINNMIVISSGCY